MKKPNLLTIILIIFFPIGAFYCILKTLGTDFKTFIGGILLLATGVVLGIYLINPDIITGLIHNLKWW